ncbi:MAG: deoxyribodipyrimidine photo-lyase [Planctomycetota bacterium]|nr:deoxyribodipyrimidine photo-lyase [Planctomycetota bacterium]
MQDSNSSSANDSLRIRVMNPHPIQPNGNCVLYWMQRAQRGRDNAALNHAIDQANRLNLPVLCLFGLYDKFPGAERRHFRFMVQGLIDVADDLAKKNIPFIVRIGSPTHVVSQILAETRPALLVSDENPLKGTRLWRELLASTLEIAFHLVDADVVIPSRHFVKDEYAARTIRPKIHKVLSSFLKPVPNPTANHAFLEGTIPPGELLDESHLMSLLHVAGASELPSYQGGSKEAQRRLDRFIQKRLANYHTERNEPTPYMTSELSAHLHFGNIDPIHVVLSVLSSGGPQESVDAYVEEFIVRRELAINYCVFNPHYDSLLGCPDWALKTLAKHASDPRQYHYTFDQLEQADSHDPLWNASQKEMVLTGRMHNYMRMYWAKKILEWTPDPETAFETTLKLNDRWEMDGRDANGYTGVAWAIGGKHDRPWGERAIFGMVRFMSYESTRKKFDSQGYIDWVRRIELGQIKRD